MAQGAGPSTNFLMRVIASSKKCAPVLCEETKTLASTAITRHGFHKSCRELQPRSGFPDLVTALVRKHCNRTSCMAWIRAGHAELFQALARSARWVALCSCASAFASSISASDTSIVVSTAFQPMEYGYPYSIGWVALFECPLHLKHCPAGSGIGPKTDFAAILQTELVQHP